MGKLIDIAKFLDPKNGYTYRGRGVWSRDMSKEESIAFDAGLAEYKRSQEKTQNQVPKIGTKKRGNK